LLSEFPQRKTNHCTFAGAFMSRDLGNHTTAVNRDRRRIHRSAHDQAGISAYVRSARPLNIQLSTDTCPESGPGNCPHLYAGNYHRDKEQITDGAFRRLAPKCDLDCFKPGSQKPIPPFAPSVYSPKAPASRMGLSTIVLAN